MFTELIRAVNYFSGNICQLIKLEMIAIRAVVDIDTLIVIGIMRKCGLSCHLKYTPAFKATCTLGTFIKPNSTVSI